MEWGWVRGIGGEIVPRYFREISEKFPGKFGKISGKMYVRLIFVDIDHV